MWGRRRPHTPARAQGALPRARPVDSPLQKLRRKESAGPTHDEAPPLSCPLPQWAGRLAMEAMPLPPLFPPHFSLSFISFLQYIVKTSVKHYASPPLSPFCMLLRPSLLYTSTTKVVLNHQLHYCYMLTSCTNFQNLIEYN